MQTEADKENYKLINQDYLLLLFRCINVVRVLYFWLQCLGILGHDKEGRDLEETILEGT